MQSKNGGLRQPRTLHSLPAPFEKLRLELERQLSWQSAGHTRMKTCVQTLELKQKTQAWCLVFVISMPQKQEGAAPRGLLSSQPHSPSKFQASETTCLKNQSGWFLEITPEVDFWPLHVCTHILAYTYVPAHVRTYAHTGIGMFVHTHTHLFLGFPLSLALVKGTV